MWFDLSSMTMHARPNRRARGTVRSVPDGAMPWSGKSSILVRDSQQAIMHTATLVTFVVYLLGMLALGVVAWRTTASLSDYILGGRRLGPAVTALSAGASDMSGWLLLGLPGAFYAAGLNQIWIVLGLLLGAWANWRFVAAPLRRASARLDDALTIPDYLEQRFADGSRALRLVSALVILLFFTFYVSSGLVSGALLFEKSFGLPYQQALLAGAAVIVAYTFLGGYLAVSWTDFVQGLLMLLALVVMPAVLLGGLGGAGETLARIDATRPVALDPLHQHTTLQAVHDFARRGASVLVILHDLNLAARYCDRLLLLQNGRPHLLGTPEEVLRPEPLRAVFGLEVLVQRHPERGHPLIVAR